MSILRRGFSIACLFALGCAGQLDSGGSDDDPAGGADARDPGFDELDREAAKAQFVTTTDLMRYVVAPGCAAQTNECHSSEDFPDMSSEGNLWNLRNLPCNVGVGERETIEDYCESVGDQLRITSGANQGFLATIGSITLVTDEQGEFLHYELLVDTPVTQAQADAGFEILHAGLVSGPLGGGNSLQVSGGGTSLSVTNADDIPDATAIRQGDENRNGVFGTGEGVIIKPGNARDSYLVRRLLGAQTARVRMPLNENSDNPTEQNSLLSPNEMYAIMSWINCMQPGDAVYSAIDYDCSANADNDGVW